jgi:two-component system OmpR family response regulator
MSSGSARVHTILVIDDSNAVLDAARTTLERAGYRVITRNRPSGSITAILNEKPDLVLLDLNMPTLSGDAILKVLCKAQSFPETVVLLHSALPLEKLRLKAVTSGAHGYVQKTDNAPEFLRRIEYWIKRSNQTTTGRMRSAQSLHQLDAPVSDLTEDRTSLMKLPLLAPLASSDPVPSASSSQPASFWVKTLFVDDDWPTLNAYKTAFGSILDAEYVASGEEAIARLLSGTPPHVVVCDLVMPFLTGADVYRRALAYDPSWADRFVFVTGAASQRSVADFLNGIDVKTFFKPVPCDRLLEAIRRLESNVSFRNAGKAGGT